MKLILLVVAATLVVTEADNQGEIEVGYHAKYGVPQAERISTREAMQSRIVGGMVSNTGENPYLAGLIIELTNGQTSVCGGSLLNARKVLTAGQCWYDGFLQGKKITVVLGSTQLFYGGVRQQVISVVAHPKFDPNNLVNDLAMLTIPGVSYNSYINPASLPIYQGNNTFEGVTAKTVGYGQTSDRASITTDQVQYGVYVPVISNAQCDAAYTSGINSDVICTSGANHWGPCNGDGGAPLVYSSYPGENMVIGVSSFHASAGCQSGFPFGYMRVSAYLPWIQSLLY